MANKEYFEIVNEILNHPEFIKRKSYEHHHEISVYDHCLAVSILSYKIAKRHNLDYKSTAIGGLLHDFYTNPWKEDTEKHKFLDKHGFTHASDALGNSKKYFPNLMNDRVENIIERHMFPLNKVPPKYMEAWVVSMVDKYVSLEALKHPMELLGLRKKS